MTSTQLTTKSGHNSATSLSDKSAGCEQFETVSDVWALVLVLVDNRQTPIWDITPMLDWNRALVMPLTVMPLTSVLQATEGHFEYSL